MPPRLWKEMFLNQGMEIWQNGEVWLLRSFAILLPLSGSLLWSSRTQNPEPGSCQAILRSYQVKLLFRFRQFDMCACAVRLHQQICVNCHHYQDTELLHCESDILDKQLSFYIVQSLRTRWSPSLKHGHFNYYYYFFFLRERGGGAGAGRGRGWKRIVSRLHAQQEIGSQTINRLSHLGVPRWVF